LVVACSFLVFVTALCVRIDGELPPFDDAYHLKRFESFPLTFDPDRGLRGAFCPWPPLYDLVGAAVLRVFGSVAWMPPLFFAAFAAGVTFALRRLGPLAACTAGLTLSLSPYLIGVSRRWHIDHHFVEPLLLLLIVVATRVSPGGERSRAGRPTAAGGTPALLGVAISVALLVQPALIIAAGVAFLILFFSDRAHEGARAFGIATLVILLYRFLQPDGYPNNGWFLGYPHAALLAGAAIACALRDHARPVFALAAGAAIASISPPLLPGLTWLSTIVEFAPMFGDPARVGTDIANLTGGAALSLALFRRHRGFALFALVYLVLALISRRFLVVGIPLFAVGAALYIAQARRVAALVAAAATLLPPLFYDMATIRRPAGTHAGVKRLAAHMRTLPPGRVLAPWSYGHAINVLGAHPVVIDNFGPAPDPELFRSATFALSAPPRYLERWCRIHGVRYVAGTRSLPPRSP
jgi:hypothetical protein